MSVAREAYIVMSKLHGCKLRQFNNKSRLQHVSGLDFELNPICKQSKQISAQPFLLYTVFWKLQNLKDRKFYNSCKNIRF